MKTACSILLWALALLLPSCRSQAVDPAPPPARFELVVAPPGARGARAAGTDAAPPPPSELGVAEPDQPGDSDDDPDAGAGSDAGAAAPEPEAGVAL